MGYFFLFSIYFPKEIRELVLPSASESGNLFKYGSKYDLYVYLSDKVSNSNFINTEKLLLEKNIDYSLLQLKKFNSTDNDSMWNLDCNCESGNFSLSDCICNFNDDKFLYPYKKYGAYSNGQNNLLKSNVCNFFPD